MSHGRSGPAVPHTVAGSGRPAWHHPLVGLARHTRDPVEVLVVVDEHDVIALGDGSDEGVCDGHALLVSPAHSGK